MKTVSIIDIDLFVVPRGYRHQDTFTLDKDPKTLTVDDISFYHTVVKRKRISLGNSFIHQEHKTLTDRVSSKNHLQLNGIKSKGRSP